MSGRCRGVWSVVLAVGLGACGDDERIVDGAVAPPPVDAAPLADAGPLVAPVEVRWSIVGPGWSILTCEDLGFARVIVNFAGPEIPCDQYGFTTAPMEIRGWFFVTFLREDGSSAAGVHGDLVRAGSDGRWIATATFVAPDYPRWAMERIFDGAVAYYEASPEPRAFPASAPLTPATGTCCAFPGQICSSWPELWSEAPWTDLGFVLFGSFRFSYGFTSTATGFTITASADWDCDGMQRVHTMTGTVQPDGTITGRDTIIVDDAD